jgi:hypothetical protein
MPRRRRDRAWAKSYKTLAKPVSYPRNSDGYTAQMFASFPPFAGLVTLAGRSYPIPSRTRPSNALAPMVLCLKTWESRPLPGLRRAESFSFRCFTNERRASLEPKAAVCLWRKVSGAGWSSPVARQAHNLKVVGSNPTPATNLVFHNVLCGF